MTLTNNVWWLGIDVGRNGAFAVWNPAKDKLHLRNMPPTPQGVYDLCKGIADLDIALCMVEKPIYMQASGVKNVSVMAFNYGVLYLSLTLTQIPFKEVAPKRWKGALDLSSDKRQSVSMAASLYPSHKEFFRLMKDNDRAEAALLAYYASKNGEIAK